MVPEYWVLSQGGGQPAVVARKWFGGYFPDHHVKEFFSICGKLVRYFSVCGWLCVANISCKGWDDKANNVPLRWMIQKTSPDNYPKRVACRWKRNASSLTTRVSPEINKSVIEDVCRLHPPKDSKYINIAVSTLHLSSKQGRYIWRPILYACIIGNPMRFRVRRNWIPRPPARCL